MEFFYYINEEEKFPKELLEDFSSKSIIKFAYTNEKKIADILFVRLGTTINRSFLSNFDNLKYLCTSTTGLTHLDLKEIESRKIKLISLAGESKFLAKIKTTADLALAFILTAQSLILTSAVDVNKGVFDRDKFFRESFNSSNIGILGLGRLGKLVADYLLKLGFNVYFFDNKEINFKNKLLNKCFSIDELFAKCKIISLHVNFNKENQNIISRKLLSINPPYKIVNTSRAQLFSYKEIEYCISDGILEQYFTDVLIEEPFENPQGVKSTKLFQLQKKYGIDRVFITPHIGGASWQSLKNCEEFIINKLYLKIIENFKNLN